MHAGQAAPLSGGVTATGGGGWTWACHGRLVTRRFICPGRLSRVQRFVPVEVVDAGDARRDCQCSSSPAALQGRAIACVRAMQQRDPAKPGHVVPALEVRFRRLVCRAGRLCRRVPLFIGGS